jgi:hypothetical protein
VPLTLPEAHVTAARVQARAINNLTLVLALGGLVRSWHTQPNVYRQTNSVACTQPSCIPVRSYAAWAS